MRLHCWRCRPLGDAHVGRLQHEAVEQFVANMERYVAGKDLENIVDKAAGY